MAHPKYPVDFEDPSTGPTAASSLSHSAPTHSLASMDTLSLTQSSRLSCTKTRNCPVSEGKMTSTYPASRTTPATHGLEDSFTRPPAATMSSNQSTIYHIPKQAVSAFNQAPSSHLKSPKIQQNKVADNKAVYPIVRTTIPATGLDDPFTGPPATSMGFYQSAAHSFLQQGMSAFNQVLASHLNCSNIQQSSGAECNMTSTYPPQLAKFAMRSNVPITSILSSNNRLNRQRSLPSGQMAGPRHPSIRSNVRQSSVPASMLASVSPTSQQIGQQSMMVANQILPSSSSTIPSQQVIDPALLNLAIPPVVQHTVSPTNVGMAVVARSSPLFVAPVPAVHQFPAQAPPPRPFLSSFTSFLRLPTELQQEIWSVAIAVQFYLEKRFLRVGPDSKSLNRTEEDAEVSQLRIISDIHRRPRLIPSLLHACTYSRNEAIKGYELWGCVDPITYQPNGAKVYVKVDEDTFFFGDADLGDFWVFHTLINESEPESMEADDTARTNFIDQIGKIKHFTFDYELWVQLLEYEALWLANLDSANQLTIAVRNPNHEQVERDFALSYMKNIIPNTFRDEAARVVMAMTRRALAASRQDLRDLNWPESGVLGLNVKALSMGTSIGNTAEDEAYLEDVLIEGNRSGIVSDQYLETRLAMMNHRAPATARAPAPAA